MANAAYWFKHDSNAKDDYKCMLLIDQLGLEGYGIYWVLIETLREQEGYRYPMAMLPILAKRYGTSGEKMRAVVASYGLFEVFEDESFSSPSLMRRMNEFEELVQRKKELCSTAGKRSAESRALRKIGKDRQLPAGVQTPLNGHSFSEEQALNTSCQAGEQPLNERATNGEPALNGCSTSDEQNLNGSSTAVEQTMNQPSTDVQRNSTDRIGQDRIGNERTRQDKRGVRGEMVGRSGKEVYDTVGSHVIPVSTVQTFLGQGYTQAEIDDVIDGLRIYQGLAEIKSIGPFMASWLRKRRDNPRPVPGARIEGIPCRLYTVQEVDKLQLWKEASIVRIEGRSACLSADGKVLLALNTDIERHGLMRREPKPVGAEWPD
jgi:hypothetical protein